MKIYFIYFFDGHTPKFFCQNRREVNTIRE